MTDIKLIDCTVRDGNQSNWGATGLDTGMMLQIAPVMERVGFDCIAQCAIDPSREDA